MEQKLIYFSIFLLVCAILGCNSNERYETKPAITTESTAANSLDTKDWPERFEIGREATVEEIKMKDIDVSPDGTGLPDGTGTPAIGRSIYLVKCASCHGQTGVEGPETKLMVEFDRAGKKQSKTIGNYWPYATTLFDYINRAMPFYAPGSLNANEVYSLTAYLLYANKIIEFDKVVTAQNLPKVVMPAQKYFVTDDRRGGPEIR